MARSDFVADFITVIRNAQKARKDKATVLTSKLTTRIAEILKEEGFLMSVKVFSEGSKNFARLQFKYVKGRRPAIQGIRRVSKPGLRQYRGYEEFGRVQGGLGIAIISTSKGILSDRQARKEKAGGEVLCTVW